MKKLIRSVLGSIDYEIIHMQSAQSYLLNHRLKLLFSRCDISCVFDIGANNGQYRDFLREEVGFDGRIESFEPAPDVAENMRKRAASDTNWNIHQIAVGEEESTLEFNIMADSRLNSFLPILADSPAAQIKDRIIVDVHTMVHILDHVVTNPDPNRTYMKIDAQGFDLAVLRGAGDLLREFPCLQIEIGFSDLYQGAASFNEIHAYLAAKNFAISGMYAVGRDSKERVRDFDSVYVNSDLL